MAVRSMNYAGHTGTTDISDMKKRLLLITAMIFLLLPALLTAQEERKIELTAQEILARVDRVLAYPRGLMKGKFMHIMPDGKSGVINLTGYVADDNSLFKLGSSGRGDQLKVLYNLSGEDIWVYHILAVKLFHKMGVDRYDPILATNFSYIDLSNAKFQSNYTASISGDAFVKGNDAYRMTLFPIFKGGSYGQVTLYVGKKDYIPLRVDFHDNDKVIFKTMTVARVMTKGKRIVPVRYDMLDIRKGTVTILEFYSFEEGVAFDKSIFMHQRLGEGD